MKKYLILFVFLLAVLIPAQDRSVTITDSVAFYADSISQTITCPKGLYPGAVYFRDSITTTLNVQVLYNTYDSTGAVSTSEWFELQKDDADYQATINYDKNTYTALPPVANYTIRKFRFVISEDMADTIYVPYDLRTY